MTPFIACSQTQEYQILVLKKVLRDKSISTFFDGIDTVRIINNGEFKINVRDKIKIDEKEIEVVDNNVEDIKALKFIEYEESKNYVIIELRMYQKNVIYSATYKKLNGRLQEVSKNVTFSRIKKYLN